jgi:hypothetical protein
MYLRCIFVAKYLIRSRHLRILHLLIRTIDKSNPLVEQVYELAPLLNGSLGPTITKIHRYMITLYVAARVPAFFTDSKEIESTNYFTLYALGKVARTLNDIKFDRTRVAFKVYKKAEEKGGQKESISVVRI